MKYLVARFCFCSCLLVLPGAADAGNAPADAKSLVPWVEWDRTPDHVVSAPNDAGAAYPRALQLSNGEILLAYHQGGGVGDYGAAITLRKSRDGGATWYQTQEVDGPRERGYWGFSNPDVIELGHGRLMLVSAARGKADPRSQDPFTSEGRHRGRRLRFCDNFAPTGGPPGMMVAGRGRVWEPSIVSLPDGELEMFYANESPTLEVEGSSQCIESIRSEDHGQTWGTPRVVSEDAGCRNGMPAALTLSNGHVVCGQEVVGLATSPWIADTVHGKTRNYRLAQDQYDFGAAPFLAAGPDGSTLLAFHSQLLQPLGFKRLPMAWMFSQIYVERGDATAGNFGPASCPWQPSADPRTGAFFPSLMVLNDGSLVALASFITVHQNRAVSTVVRWVKGRMTGPEATPSAEKTAAVPSSAAGHLLVTSPAAESASTASPRVGAEYKYGPPPETETGSNGAGY